MYYLYSSSTQFIYFKNAKTVSDKYYQVSRSKSDRTNAYCSYSYGSIENYLSDMIDSIMSLMYKQPLLPDAAVTYDISITPIPETKREITCVYEEIRTTIKNIAIDLIPFIDDATKIFLQSNTKSTKRISKLRSSFIENIGKFIFVQVLTLSILQGEDKTCYEPWMIWAMWKCIPRNASGEISNKIFDLSPWWGE